MEKILNDIRSGNFKQIYLLFGEERYLLQQYKDNLLKALSTEGDTMNTSVFEGKGVNIGQLIDLAETLPFFAERRVIYLKDTGLLKSGGEQLAEYFKEPCSTTYFIFSETEVDKRSKLYKAITNKGYAAEFVKLDEGRIRRWIGSKVSKEGKKITEDAYRSLLDRCGQDMSTLSNELEKLFSYTLDRDAITLEDVDMVCTAQVTGHIFEMIDALGNGNKKIALGYYYDLLALKEPSMRILFMIGRHCNILLQIKEALGRGNQNQKQLASTVGVPPFAVSKYMAQASKFSRQALMEALEACVQTDEDVKSGRMNDQLGVEVLIMSILSPTPQNK